MESVTGLSVSVTRLWEMMSGLWVVWVWVLVGHYVVESGLFGFVGMDLTVVAVVLLLDFRWWWWWWLLCCGFDIVAGFDEKELYLIKIKNDQLANMENVVAGFAL